MDYILSFIFFFITYAISKSMGNMATAIFCLILGIQIYTVSKEQGIALILTSILFFTVKLLFDGSSSAKDEAANYPPEACEDTVFGELKFGMSKKEVMENKADKDSAIYGYLLSKHKKCEVTCKYHEEELYKVTAKFYADFIGDAFEIERIIHKIIIGKGYKRHGNFLFGYCYTKKNIIVSLNEKSISFISGRCCVITVEYLNAPIKKEIELG